MTLDADKEKEKEQNKDNGKPKAVKCVNWGRDLEDSYEEEDSQEWMGISAVCFGEGADTTREGSYNKLKEIAKYKKLLQAKPAKPANLSRGRALYQRTCAQCHKLYGEGGEIGPDITGSNRNNLDYLLTNMLDPNAEIPNDYRTTILRTKDNRILVGVVRRSEGQSVTMATPAEVVTVSKSDVASIEQQNFSMMPEGLVLAFKQDELHDLVAYLRGTGQVQLPKE